MTPKLIIYILSKDSFSFSYFWSIVDWIDEVGTWKYGWPTVWGDETNNVRWIEVNDKGAIMDSQVLLSDQPSQISLGVNKGNVKANRIEMDLSCEDSAPSLPSVRHRLQYVICPVHRLQLKGTQVTSGPKWQEADLPFQAFVSCFGDQGELTLKRQRKKTKVAQMTESLQRV